MVTQSCATSCLNTSLLCFGNYHGKNYTQPVKKNISNSSSLMVTILATYQNNIVLLLRPNGVYAILRTFKNILRPVSCPHETVLLKSLHR